MNNLSKSLIVVAAVVIFGGIIVFYEYTTDQTQKKEMQITEVFGTLYRYPNCPHCEKVLSFMAEKGIKISNEKYLDNTKKFNKTIAQGHPVLVVENDVWVGPEEIIANLSKLTDTKNERK